MVADNALANQIDQFVAAGADIISIHAENADVGKALDRIAARAWRPVSCCSFTPVASIGLISTGWQC